MNILIIKIGALGDVVRSTFLAQALIVKYQDKTPKVYWLTDKKAEPLFINNPYIHQLVNTENKDSLKKIDFDLVLNLEEDAETCKFATELNPQEIIGFFYKDGKILPSETAKYWYNMSVLGPKPKNDILKRSNKKTHREILSEIIQVDPTKYEPFLRLTEKQRAFASEFMRRYNLSRKDIIIGVNTGAADRWPKSLSIKKTAELIDKLYAKYKPKILLFGGPNEVERNKEILRLVNSPVIDTGCGNNLVEFPALISVCRFFITTDSLGLHISLALKRKTIVLIGPTPASELEMYGLGERVIARSNCVFCLKPECKSMEKINISDILNKIDLLIKQKITILITAYKEPLTIKKAIDACLNQKTDYDFNIVVSAPDDETLNVAKKYSLKNSKVKLFKDPGKGKSLALNLNFSKIDSDILILTDGDVFISNNSVQDIVDLFLDPEIGCITGCPVPQEDKSTKYGYWANFLFDSAHKLRKKASMTNDFIECSGYLFAFRKNVIKSIPLDVAEDAVIPYYFWEKGYKIGYAENAEVYVKNVDNWKDWISQKTRTTKAHETLEKYVDTRTTQRVKTFGNEFKGIFNLIAYPRSFKQAIWTGELALARGYMWIKVFLDTKIKNRQYNDAWERVESTK